MSLESEIDIIAENERIVDKFALEYFNTDADTAVHIFGTPEVTKRHQKRPCGHDGKAYKMKFIKYADIIFECSKYQEKNYPHF